MALIHLNLGATLLAVRRVDEAVAVCREATQIEPKMLSAWSNLGRAQMQLGDAAGATETFQKALAISPGNADLHHLQGIALRSDRRLDEAIQAQRRALEIDPNMGLAREQLIKALVQKGAVEEARTEWRRLSGLIAGSAIDHNSFGVLLAEIGQLEAATKEFESAQRIAPNDPDTKNNLARAYKARARAGKPVSSPPR